MSKSRKRGRHQGARIKDHKRLGKKLIAPYGQLPNMELTSWRDDRLPEVLWAALLSAQMDQPEYLEVFRTIASSASENRDIDCSGMSHSKFASYTDDQFDRLFAPIINDATLTALLQPLRLFEELPDSSHWNRHIPEFTNEEKMWGLVDKAVANNTWHQSQIATDVSWMIVVCMIASGKMNFPETMNEQYREIMEYPNHGDMREVRPSIRSVEQVCSRLDDSRGDKWPTDFWRDCLSRTPCFAAARKKAPHADVKAMVDETLDLYKLVADHFHTSITDTGVDARLDGVFGISLYAIILQATLLSSRSHERVEGRLLIRTILEMHITLAFLLSKDQPTYWERYRMYGTGQAKLAFLKLADLEDQDIPSYVTLEELEELANEDRWKEFVDIDLGNWAKLDLRRMSDEAGVKDLYDKYYGWPSGFVHGHWAAVRDTVFDLCLNPLHRYHRIPSPPRLDMRSVAPDGVKLINLTLDLISRAYPPFKARLKMKNAEVQSHESSAVSKQRSTQRS